MQTNKFNLFICDWDDSHHFLPHAISEQTRPPVQRLRRCRGPPGDRDVVGSLVPQTGDGTLKATSFSPVCRRSPATHSVTDSFWDARSRSLLSRAPPLENGAATSRYAECLAVRRQPATFRAHAEC